MSQIDKIEERLAEIDYQLYSRFQLTIKEYHFKRYHTLHQCLLKTKYYEHEAIGKCMQAHLASNQAIHEIFQRECALYSSCYQGNNSPEFNQQEEKCLESLQDGLAKGLSLLDQ